MRACESVCVHARMRVYVMYVCERACVYVRVCACVDACVRVRVCVLVVGGAFLC